MGAWFDSVNIEFEGDGRNLRIAKATDTDGNDIKHEFKKPKKFKHHKKNGDDENEDLLPYGTVLVTQRNPTCCWWVRCGDGWYYRCVTC